MNFWVNFKRYRRWRGGKWALITGLLWGMNWVRFPCDAEGYFEENYCDK